MNYKSTLKIFFGFGEVCDVDNEVADMKYACFIIVNILRMKLYLDILCLLSSDEDCVVSVFS
jgi:hypothetical protein